MQIQQKYPIYIYETLNMQTLCHPEIIQSMDHVETLQTKQKTRKDWPVQL